MTRSQLVSGNSSSHDGDKPYQSHKATAGLVRSRGGHQQKKCHQQKRHRVLQTSWHSRLTRGCTVIRYHAFSVDGILVVDAVSPGAPSGYCWKSRVWSEARLAPGPPRVLALSHPPGEEFTHWKERLAGSGHWISTGLWDPPLPFLRADCPFGCLPPHSAAGA